MAGKQGEKEPNAGDPDVPAAESKLQRDYKCFREDSSEQERLNQGDKGAHSPQGERE